MLKSKKIKGKSIVKFFDIVDNSKLSASNLYNDTLDLMIGGMLFNNLEIDNEIFMLLDYLKYNYAESFVEATETTDYLPNITFWNKFKEINTLALYRFLKVISMNNSYELIKKRGVDRESIINIHSTSEDTEVENNKEITLNNVSGKYADNPVGVSGDLVDTFTSRQDKITGDSDITKDRDITKNSHKDDTNTNTEFNKSEFEKVMYDNTNFNFLNEYAKAFKVLFVPYATEELEFEEWN